VTDPRRRAELEPIFRATDYVVLLPDGELILEVGRYDLDGERRIVAATGCRHGWQLLTPVNPGAEQVSEAANRIHLADFHRDLRAWGGAWHATLTRTRGADDWPEEPGALIVDAPTGFAHELAHRYRQRAYLAASIGHAPELVWLE
jgi:hypothetical protein